MDLIIIILLTVITFPVVALTDGIPRIILGVIFLLVFPGYTLISALFPKKTSIKGIERAAFTLVLSFALVALTGLALNYTPWGIRLTPIVVSVAIIIFITAGIASIRRMRISDSERFSISLKMPVLHWRSESKFDIVLSIILVIAVIGAISTLVYVISKPKAEEAFTNFYILGPEGRMENYPQELILGEQAEITLGIENHENKPASYDVVVIINGEEMETIDSIALTNGGEWSDEVALIPSKAGDNQRVELILYKGGETVPYLTLHLWLDVKGYQ